MKRIFLICTIFALSAVRMLADVDPNFYIYLCFGQSNMEGNAQWESQDTYVDPRFQMLATTNFDNPKRTMGNWYTANCPIVSPMGKLGPSDYFGRTMIKAFSDDVKIGVVAVAMGGSPIEMFDKDKYQAEMQKKDDNGGTPWHVTLANNYYGGNPYGRLIEMAKKAQQVGVIKGILLHQGCSNCGNPEWPDMVKKIYNDMLTDLGLEANDVPLFAGEVEYQNMGGGCSSHNVQVNRLPSVIPTAHVVSAKDIPGNGTDPWHFSAAGYRTLGKRYAYEVLRVMGVDLPEDADDESSQAKTLYPDQFFTSLTDAQKQPFAIVSAEGKLAFYGSTEQNLGFASYETAFDEANTGFYFKLEDSTVAGCYLLRLMTPYGGEYSIWGSPGYLNSQPADQWCSFILGLNNQNGQDMKNGAVWDIQYVDGKGFTLKNVGTGLYLHDATPAKYESPAYFRFCTLSDQATAGISTVVSNRINNHAYYDLSGRRVAKPGKGLYIHNGQKIYIK